MVRAARASVVGAPVTLRPTPSGVGRRPAASSWRPCTGVGREKAPGGARGLSRYPEPAVLGVSGAGGEEEDNSRREVSHGRLRPGLCHRPRGGSSCYSPRS